MTAPRDFVQLIESLRDADPDHGILLVNTRFQESFHSYPGLLRRVRALASRFHEQNLRRGHKVLIAPTTRIEEICSFLAVAYLGAVPYSVSPPLLSQDREAHARRIVEQVRLHGIDRVLNLDSLAGVAEAAGTTPLQADGNRPPNVPTVEPASVAPDDTAFVQFSSGSSAHPKGVPITHRNLLYNLKLIVDNDRRTGESVMVSWLPLCHDMGLVGCLLSNLVHGNKLVLMDPLCFMTRPISWLSAITKMKGTTTAVPNFGLDLCTSRVDDEQLKEHAIDLSTFRYVYDGSEPVRVESIRRFEEKFAQCGFAPGSIYPVYGMAETTLIISAPGYGEGLASRRIEGMEVPSVGRPLGDFRVEIRDDRGAPLAADRIGEIFVSGTSLTPGYLSSTEPGVRDGWLATGDLGLQDADGRLYITGRLKDLIIYQGRNFYGHDIAARLEELAGVRKGKVFVFSIDIEGREEVVVMTTAPRQAPLAEFKTEIRRFVLREFGLPVDDVHIVRQLPKTTSGKVARHRCAQIYREHRGRTPPGGP